MFKVNSDSIERIEYDHGKLTICYHNNEYKCFKIPKNVFKELKESDSLENFIDNQIISNYPTVYCSLRDSIRLN